jgi:hypothetical protein
MTDSQVLAIQAYVLACVRYSSAHHLEKSEALMDMVHAQEHMRNALVEGKQP